MEEAVRMDERHLSVQSIQRIRLISVFSLPQEIANDKSALEFVSVPEEIVAQIQKAGLDVGPVKPGGVDTVEGELAENLAHATTHVQQPDLVGRVCLGLQQSEKCHLVVGI